jgi:hypothetical protein
MIIVISEVEINDNSPILFSFLLGMKNRNNVVSSGIARRQISRSLTKLFCSDSIDWKARR